MKNMNNKSAVKRNRLKQSFRKIIKIVKKYALHSSKKLLKENQTKQSKEEPGSSKNLYTSFCDDVKDKQAENGNKKLKELELSRPRRPCKRCHDDIEGKLEKEKPESSQVQRKRPCNDEIYMQRAEESQKRSIILNDNVQEKTKETPSETLQKPSKRPHDDILTESDYKRLKLYNFNVYNPHTEYQVRIGKRMILIDGSNVAFAHSNHRQFSVKGLEICIKHFEQMGHPVKAVVPENRFESHRSSNPNLLRELRDNQKLVITPCKNLPTSRSSPYDDRITLQLASEVDAAIISNDSFRDLFDECPAITKIIQNRVIGFSWCGDVFMIVRDPYGRNKLSLDEILYRKE